KRLAVGCAHPDCRIHLWDIESGGLRTLEGHQADVISLAYNHAGTLLASSSWDQTTRFWDAMSGRQLETVAAGSHSGFSTDDARVAVGDIIHEVTFGSEYRTLHGHQGSDKGPWLADISPDGQLVVSASGDGVRLWSPDSGREAAWLRIGESCAACFHPRDGSLFTAGVAGVFRWPIAPQPQGDPRGIVMGPPLTFGVPKRLRPSCMSLSQDGTRLAVSDLAHSVVLVLESQTGKILLQARYEHANYLRLSPDGRWLACNTWGLVHGRVQV